MAKRIRDKFTTEGGNRAYNMVRSKVVKGKDGYGKVVSVAREKLMERLGRDPGPDTVAAHEKGGSHFEKDGGDFDIATRAENTAQSNRARKLKEKFKRGTK
jgi:hypothetical protein